MSNATRVLSGVDIRGEHGYIVAPPSIHPNGKRYTWLSGPTSRLPEFPSVLAGQIKSGGVTARGVITTRPETWLSDALAGLKEGSRNDTFARIIGKLHYQGLDKTAIWTLLLPHAHACGFSDTELNSVLQSITKREGGKTQSAESGSVEIFLKDITPVEWICKPVIANGSLGFIAGLPETYKTWLTIDLAIECAKGGGLWLGLFPVEGKRVLFIDQERNKAETQRRFKGVMAAKGIEASSLKDRLFIKSGTTTRLDLDDSFRAFRGELLAIRPDLVIVDSFATFHIGDENDRMSIQKVMERIKELRSEIGCAFLFIDHENKGAYSAQADGEAPNAGRMVGSIGKVAASESCLTVRRYDAGTCSVFHTKSTMGERVPSFNVHVDNTPEGGIRVWGQNAKEG